MSQLTIPFPAALPRGTRTPRARVLPAVAAVGVLSVICSLTAMPERAHASTHALTTISASMRADTVPEDIASGRISVQDLVEVNLSARTSPASAAERAALTDEVKREVATIRAASSADNTAPAGTLGLWHRIKGWFKHWGTATVDTTTALAASAFVAGAWATLSAVLAFLGSVYLTIIFVALTAASGTLAVLAGVCTAANKRHMVISVPDLKNSSCQD